MKPTEIELSAIAAEMESWTPQQILRWAWDTYGQTMTMATAFGAEGCVIVSMLSEITKEANIFNLDTGYQFPETLATRERLIEKYGLPIRFVASQQSVASMEAELGGPIYNSNPDLCCHIRKVVPLREAVAGFDAWITAIRREQTPDRATQPIVGFDPKFQLVKINPLANWTKVDVWNYIVANDVPYNPLHDLGFPSIGCWPCTKSVAAGEDERAGRWAGKAKTECGLHVQTNTAPVAL